jgi:glucose-6-phosphate isomerase|tara:strand:- start:6738 stop:7901 length:1164 start_codon:yes stop_codon:yes gene_type:complete
MLTKNIKFKKLNLFGKKFKKIKNLNYYLKTIDNEVIKSLSNSYKYSYLKKNIHKYKKAKLFRVIGMGGSILGANAIYDFLYNKINKKFVFIDNLKVNEKKSIYKKKPVNLVISKSGNTIETIINANLLLKKNEENIFITEKKNNYLNNLAKELKANIISHNNYIGGRYSVLSEVGMLPAELMGLNEKKFKQYNYLINKKSFLNSLVDNVSRTICLVQNKKFNSVILNYDEKSDNLFKWYQQLIAESLGKKSKGILPIISSMPKDNHSLMQLYLDGPSNYFYTFFSVKNKDSLKINNNTVLSSHKYLKNKDINKIIHLQKKATENVFFKKKIPFRSFEVNKRDEKTLGELFCFFILETILLGKALNVNPYDQPSVELIKIETKKLLIN